VNTAAATLGCRMPPHRSFDERLASLERLLDDEKEAREKLQTEVKPIVDFYTAGTTIGKLLWIIGGILTGAAVIWASFSGWITSHWK
jgi:hypothetical protein